MTDDARSAAELLARARRAWSPSAADAERVRQAIECALPAGTGTLPRGPTTAAPWARRMLLAVGIATASGSAGYWAGHRAGFREAQATVPAISAGRPAHLIAAAPPAAAQPVATPEPKPALPSLVPARHTSHAARSEPPAPASRETDSLAIEVRALRNVERALRDGNPGLALAFLEELDRQVPHGHLSEERDAAATLARCARGDHPFGVDLAGEFAELHPSSVYRARVEQACAAKDSPPSGDSPSRRSGP